MYIYDSVKKTKTLFEPIKEGDAFIYVCGPTAYDDAHLGHARSSVVFDLLRRVLRLKYRVTFLKNFTDIDDKIIKKMNETNESLEDITSFYIKRYKKDMKSIYVKDPDMEPKATNSLRTIVNFIQSLLNKGVAYKTKSGVYFDTSTDEKYLSISNRNIDEKDAQSRIEKDEYKKDAKDFALWKFTKKGEKVSYEAPFGEGRPGWHIECSAMIKEHLASKSTPYQIDIHCGGADLLFPHHENEAAQTRKESGQEIAKYWMHNGFVTIGGEKMSKSLGNSFFLKDILRVYDGEIVRFYLMSAHYRANINFNENDLLQSKKRLDKIYRLKSRIADAKNAGEIDKTFKNEFVEALEDDLNISKALSVIDAMINEANDSLDKNPKDDKLKETLRANFEFITSLIGIGNLKVDEYFKLGISEEEKIKIEELINARLEAKKNKEFKKADDIRDELAKMGVTLMDGICGTKWEKIWD